MEASKKYCVNHKAVAVHNNLYMQIHGIVNYIDSNIVYLVERVYKNAFGDKTYKFHRCLIRYYADGTPYIRVHSTHWDGTKQSQNISLNEFIRLGTWVQNPYFTANELAA